MPLASLAAEVVPTDGDEKPAAVKEDSVGIYESENKVNEDYALDGYTQTIPAATSEQLTQSAYKSPAAEKEKVDAEEDPNSAMSFNFVYYIIDKFKLADPLD